MNLHHRTGSLFIILMFLEHVFILDLESERSSFGFFEVLLSIHVNQLIIFNLLLVVLSLVDDLILMVEDRVAYFER